MTAGLPDRSPSRPIPPLLWRLGRLLGTVFGRLMRILLFVVLRIVGWVSLFAFQIFLSCLTLYLLIYFFMNSTFGRDTIVAIVDRVVPGRIVASNIEWGPWPGHARLSDVNILTEEGVSVIRAGEVIADVDLEVLYDYIVNGLIRQQKSVQLRFSRAEVRNYEVDVDLRQGHMPTLVGAFYKPKPPSGILKPPKHMRISVENIVTRRGLVNVLLPDLRIQSRQVDINGGYVLVEGIEHKATYVHAPVVRVPGGTLTLGPRISPRYGGGTLDVPLANFIAVGFNYYDGTIDIPQLRSTVSKLQVAAQLQGVVRGERSFRATMHMEGPAEDPVLAALQPYPLSGAFRLDLTGRGSFDDVRLRAILRSEYLTLADAGLPQLALRARLARDAHGDKPYRIDLDEVSSTAFGGWLSLHDAWLVPGWLRPVPSCESVAGAMQNGPLLAAFAGRLDLSAIDLQRVGKDLARFIPALPPSGLVRSASGTVEIQGGFPLQPGSSTALQTRVAANLQLTRDVTMRLPLAATYGLDGTVRLAFPAGHKPRLDLSDLALRSGSDLVLADGVVDLNGPELDLGVEVVLPDLEHFANSLGVHGLSGSAELRGGQIRGTLLNPQFDGRLAGTDIRFGRIVLNRLRAHANLSHGTVTVDGLAVEAPWGQIQTAGTLELWRGSLLHLSADLPFAFERIQAANVDLARLLPELAVKGIVTLPDLRVRGNLRDPLATLTGRGQVAVDGLEVHGQPVGRITAQAMADRQWLRLEQLSAIGPGGMDIHGKGALNRRNGHLKADLSVATLDLRTIERLLGTALPVRGLVGLQLQASGPLRQLDLEARMPLTNFALRVGGKKPKNVRLGDAELVLRRQGGGPLTIAANQFFEHLTLDEGSALELAGYAPRKLNLQISLAKLKPLSYVALNLSPLSDVDLNGRLRVSYDWTAPQTDRWRLELRIPRASLGASLYDGGLRYTSVEPARFTLGPLGLTISKFHLRGSSADDVAICGQVGFDGQSDLLIGGSMGTDVLRFLKRKFTTLEGTVTILPAEDPATAAATTCMAKSLPAGTGTLHVTGPLTNPDVAGRLRLDGFRIQPREFPSEIRLAAGSQIWLQPGPSGSAQQRILLSQDTGLRGELDEGVFHLWGDVRLHHWLPDHGTLQLTGSDLTYASSQAYTVTLNPQLKYEFDALQSPEHRWSRLSGQVLVQEGAFFQSFDMLTRAFGGVLDRQETAPTKSLTDAVPQLADMELDVSVLGSNFEIRSKFPAGRADLDLNINLKIDGTLSRPLLWDRIDIQPGSIVTYNLFKREFEVQGSVDFKGDPMAPFLDLKASTDVSYFETTGNGPTSDANSSEAREEEKSATITLHILGVYPNIDLKPTSDSSQFSEADLWSLIVTGQPADPTRKMAQQSSITVLTDDLADVVRKTLLSAFMDNVSVGFTQQGGVDTTMVKRLGRMAVVRARVVQGATTLSYQTGFDFKISDWLSLEGNVRVYEDNLTTSPIRKYETKLRYRIPLE